MSEIKLFNSKGEYLGTLEELIKDVESSEELDNLLYLKRVCSTTNSEERRQ